MLSEASFRPLTAAKISDYSALRLAKPDAPSSARPLPGQHDVAQGFAPGTLITTGTGQIPAQNLQCGDRVLTRDRGFQPLLWIGHGKIAQEAQVHIRAGALGNGLPERDITLSPGHRLLIRDHHLIPHLNNSETLVEARMLTGLPGVSLCRPRPLRGIRLLFRSHEIILSDNIWTESLYLSRPALRALLQAGHSEILDFFPQSVRDKAPAPHSLARICIPGHQEAT